MTLQNLLLKVRYVLHLLTVGRLHDAPYHCHFQVTRRCNFKCPSCAVWSDTQTPNELSLQEIELLAKNLHQIGVKSIALTGGEPLLRKDIPEIVNIFKHNGFIVRLQTNGYLLKEALLETLIAQGVDDIHISLDTLKADRFIEINGVTRPETFKVVLSNIKSCAKLAREHGRGLFLTTILRASTLDEVESLHKFAKNLYCFIGFYGLEVCEKTDKMNIRTSNKHLIPDKKACHDLKNTFMNVKRLKQEKHSLIFMADKLLDDYTQFYASGAKSMRWNCHAGLYYLEVLSDGSIAVCNGTPAIEGYNYKNLVDLYQSPDKEHIFQQYRNKCSGCICTRQLEYLAGDFLDMLGKTVQYLWVNKGSRQ